MKIEKDAGKFISKIKKLIFNKKLAKKGDRIVITMGFPIGNPGSTNKVLVLEL
jgi:pyruvate kinase